MRRAAFAALLESLSLTDMRVAAWQVDYDIAWARKRSREYALEPDRCEKVPSFTLPALLRCPRCAGGPLARQSRAFTCDACNSRYPIADDGVVEMGY